MLPPLRSLHIEIKESVLKEQLHSGDKRILRDLCIVGQNINEVKITG